MSPRATKSTHRLRRTAGGSVARSRRHAAILYSLLTLLSAFPEKWALAADTPVAQTTTRVSPAQALEQQARLWDLTTAEWQQYQALMQGRRGTWSPGLDPVTALGVHAHTAEERRRFAELYVQQTYARTEQELAFQRAVNAAWARLYPDRLPLAVARASAGAAAVQPYDRYALLVEDDCAACEAALQNQLDRVAADDGIGLDIYLADSARDDTRLRQWADRQGIPPETVSAGRITLNHGGASAGALALPALYARQRDGQ